MRDNRGNPVPDDKFDFLSVIIIAICAFAAGLALGLGIH